MEKSDKQKEIKLRADAYGEMKDFNNDQPFNLDDTPSKLYSAPAQSTKSINKNL